MNPLHCTLLVISMIVGILVCLADRNWAEAPRPYWYAKLLLGVAIVVLALFCYAH